jgi:hypothetical protein
MERIRPKSVKPLNNYLLKVEFSNGEIRKYDCKPYLNGDWFSEFLDINVFNTFRVSGNTGKATSQGTYPRVRPCL